MWIFTNKGFLSIVAHRAKEDFLLVRAREPGVIEAFWPKAKVKETPNADYRYRASIEAEFVADVLGAEIFEEIDYDNFKDSIPAEKQEYHDACMSVWWVMKNLQDGRRNPAAVEEETLFDLEK